MPDLPFPILPEEGVGLALRLAHKHYIKSHQNLITLLKTVLPSLSPTRARTLLEAANELTSNGNDLVTATVLEITELQSLTFYHELWARMGQEHNENIIRMNKNDEMNATVTQGMHELLWQMAENMKEILKRITNEDNE